MDGCPMWRYRQSPSTPLSSSYCQTRIYDTCTRHKEIVRVFYKWEDGVARWTMKPAK